MEGCDFFLSRGTQSDDVRVQGEGPGWYSEAPQGKAWCLSGVKVTGERLLDAPYFPCSLFLWWVLCSEDAHCTHFYCTIQSQDTNVRTPRSKRRRHHASPCREFLLGSHEAGPLRSSSFPTDHVTWTLESQVQTLCLTARTGAPMPISTHTPILGPENVAPGHFDWVSDCLGYSLPCSH